MSTEVTLIAGDGIGPEVVDASLRLLSAAGAQLTYDAQDAGTGALAKHGTPIPDETLASITRTKVALKGPLATPIGEGFRSVNVALRQQFRLYANIRPARSFEGIKTPFPDVDVVVLVELLQPEGFTFDDEVLSRYATSGGARPLRASTSAAAPAEDGAAEHYSVGRLNREVKAALADRTY